MHSIVEINSTWINPLNRVKHICEQPSAPWTSRTTHTTHRCRFHVGGMCQLEANLCHYGQRTKFNHDCWLLNKQGFLREWIPFLWKHEKAVFGNLSNWMSFVVVVFEKESGRVAQRRFLFNASIVTVPVRTKRTESVWTSDFLCFEPTDWRQRMLDRIRLEMSEYGCHSHSPLYFNPSLTGNRDLNATPGRAISVRLSLTNSKLFSIARERQSRQRVDDKSIPDAASAGKTYSFGFEPFLLNKDMACWSACCGTRFLSDDMSS